jgi:type II secretory pathway pseudopilin PulG
MVLNEMLPEVTTWDDAQRAALRCETTLYKTQTSNGVLELPTFTSSNIDTLAATALQQQQKQIEELQTSHQKLKRTPSSTWDPINAEDHHNVTSPTLPFVGPTTPTTTQTPSNDTAPKAETDNIQTLPTTDITNHSHRRHNNHTLIAPKALPIDQIHQADLRVPTAGTTTLKIFNAIAVKILDTSLKNVGQKTPNDCVDPRNKLQTQIL